MDDKIIVTHRGALRGKYQAAGLAAIRQALAALIAADKQRGIATSVIYLDDAKQMKAVGGAAVQTASNPRENKAAIDAVCKARDPAYLMILGAPDVVPHQDLDNPAFEGDDTDAQAWGDIPYACEAPYSRDPAKFVGPTRVVGRLPDLTGATEPSHLLALLKVATDYQRLSAADYVGHFGLSAAQWKGSSRMSLQNLFGSADALLLSPPKGPAHPAAALQKRTHFINCHGGSASPEFQGQLGKKYPVSLSSAALAGKVTPGTVAAVECCFGGELYDSVTLGIDLPICQTYLAQGAYGYLGSTTIAYGPADDNGVADLMCQYFLAQVFQGASLGRAALLARQQYAQQVAQMDPIDLKTMAQFVLLGDPSLHPVAAASPHAVTAGAAASPHATKAAPAVRGVAAGDVERYARAERRAKLKTVGRFLAQTTLTASQRVKAPALSPTVRGSLAAIAQAAGLTTAQAFSAFAVAGQAAPAAAGTKSRGAKPAAAQPTRYHVAIGEPAAAAAARSAKTVKAAGAPPHLGVAVVAKELGGRIVGYRIYQQR